MLLQLRGHTGSKRPKAGLAFLLDGDGLGRIIHDLDGLRCPTRRGLAKLVADAFDSPIGHAFLDRVHDGNKDGGPGGISRARNLPPARRLPGYEPLGARNAEARAFELAVPFLGYRLGEARGQRLLWGSMLMSAFDP